MKANIFTIINGKVVNRFNSDITKIEHQPYTKRDGILKDGRQVVYNFRTERWEYYPQ